MHVVGYEQFPFQQLFHHRMLAIPDGDLLPVIQPGTHIAALVRCHGQGIQHIQFAQGMGCFLYLHQMLPHILTDFVEQVVFQLLDFLLGAEDLVLESLQFGDDVPFPVHQGLFADEGVGNLGNLPLGNFNIIPEDLIVAHLQVLDARFILDFLFEIGHPLVVVLGNVVDLVQLGTETPADHAPFPYGKGRIVHNAPFQFIQQVLMESDTGIQGMEQPLSAFAEQLLHLGQGPQGRTESRQVTGVGRSHFDPGQDPFQIGDLAQCFTHPGAELGGVVRFAFLYHITNGLLTQGNPCRVQQGCLHPLAQLPGTHGRAGVVQHIQQGTVTGAVLHVLHQFQVADGRGVQIHDRICGDFPQLVDLGQITLHVFVDIAQHGFHRFVHQGIPARRITAKMLAEIIHIRDGIIVVHHAVGQFLPHCIQKALEHLRPCGKHQFCR